MCSTYVQLWVGVVCLFMCLCPCAHLVVKHDVLSVMRGMAGCPQVAPQVLPQVMTKAFCALKTNGRIYKKNRHMAPLSDNKDWRMQMLLAYVEHNNVLKWIHSRVASSIIMTVPYMSPWLWFVEQIKDEVNVEHIRSPFMGLHVHPSSVFMICNEKWGGGGGRRREVRHGRFLLNSNGRGDIYTWIHPFHGTQKTNAGFIHAFFSSFITSEEGRKEGKKEGRKEE